RFHFELILKSKKEEKSQSVDFEFIGSSEIKNFEEFSENLSVTDYEKGFCEKKLARLFSCYHKFVSLIDDEIETSDVCEFNLLDYFRYYADHANDR
ncbi:MAG: hypothetical protein K6F69_03885, partial [Treponema sp.]|nr:hypothetical protein [Treponema sp.]